MPAPFKNKLIVVTDLDATLLDHNTYSFDPARPALQRIRDESIPLVIVTSKTKAEIAPIRERLEIGGIDIAENGAWSRSYEWICQTLSRAADDTGTAIRAAHQMTDEEFASDTGLSIDTARLAKNRHFSEAFHVLDKDRTPALLQNLEAKGLRWTRGGRFYHTFEKGSKGEAVQQILNQFPGAISIGFGDAPNDIDFLRLVDHAVIVRSPRTPALTAVLPNASVTQLPGPAGWNQALLALLDEQAQSAYRP